ncbi:hypothetical protein LCGC14_0273710 [marine sediment metagenome]|uniref:Uncharacterized protein n=2 Tax=root TaxID=1 RepID=A0A9C9NJI4_9HYPH|nr:hypothetical protein [Aurantimonas coralicida]
MTNRVFRFAFALFDTEPWLQLGQAPPPPVVPGPTQLDVNQRGLGNRLSVFPSRNALTVATALRGNRLSVFPSRNTLDAVDTRNILDTE